MSKIYLTCVKEAGKLRIKFHTFFDTETNQIYKNSYNNTYNCQFPKDIRKEGLYYEILSSDLSLSGLSGTPFYRIKKGNIKILQNEPNFSEGISSNFLPPKIFIIDECICCMENVPNKVIIPCGHQCLCSGCYQNLRNKNCPICRTNITQIIDSV